MNTRNFLIAAFFTVVVLATLWWIFTITRVNLFVTGPLEIIAGTPQPTVVLTAPVTQGADNIKGIVTFLVLALVIIALYILFGRRGGDGGRPMRW